MLPVEQHGREGAEMSFGSRLQALRHRHGITQEAFAQQLNVSRQAVSKWESSRGYPEMEKLLYICKHYGVTMDELFADEVPAPDARGEREAQEELTDVHMLDSVPAHVELVQRNNIFREVIPNAVVNTELPVDGFRRRQKVCDLNVELLSLFFADKVNLLVASLSDGDIVAPAQQFQKNDVLQNQIDVPHIAAVDRLTDTVVCDVVFLVGGQNLLALKILPLDLIQQECVSTEFQIIQDRLRGYRTVFVPEEFDH